MKKINTWDEALMLLKQGETLLSSSFGGPITFYALKKNRIQMSNENLKACISLEEMKIAFQEGRFYLFEKEEKETEIDQNDRYWRQ